MSRASRASHVTAGSLTTPLTAPRDGRRWPVPSPYQLRTSSDLLAATLPLPGPERAGLGLGLGLGAGPGPVLEAKGTLAGSVHACLRPPPTDCPHRPSAGGGFGGDGRAAHRSPRSPLQSRPNPLRRSIQSAVTSGRGWGF
eukprot:gene11734-biopygen9866